jgi:hypothetical protein
VLAGETVFTQWVHRKGDGTDFPCEVTLNRIDVSSETLILGIVRDITERKQAHDALSLANRKLSLLNAIMRHDIRNRLMVLDVPRPGEPDREFITLDVESGIGKNVEVTASAYWRLEWLCHRTPNEVSAMGLLLPTERGILIQDFILVRQEVGPASVSLDMNWWADKQIDLFDKYGIEPWRTSVWAHTHPAGINRPSTTDEQTMEESFGGWDFVVMLILTKAGHFYARMDFDHGFGNGTKQRLSAPCK